MFALFETQHFQNTIFDNVFFILDKSDKDRYDTTIGIPTNLEDGLYVLQLAMLIGNIFQPYYSCGKLNITGGDPAFICNSNEPPILYDCLKTGGGRNLIGFHLHTGKLR